MAPQPRRLSATARTQAAISCSQAGVICRAGPVFGIEVRLGLTTAEVLPVAPVADHRLGSWGWIRSRVETAINENGSSVFLEYSRLFG